MNRIQKIAVVITLLAGVVPVLAQNGPEPPGRGEFRPPMGPPGVLALERLDRQLELTDAQKSQIQTLLSGQREALRASMATMRQAEQALAAAVMQVPADDNAIQARANDLAAVQAQ